MKYTMNHISCGEDEVIVNYLSMTPEIARIVNFIKGEQTKLAGRKDKEQKVIDIKSILYIETVDGNVPVTVGFFLYVIFAYICGFLVYKIKRTLESKALNEDLKAFKERRNVNEQGYRD